MPSTYNGKPVTEVGGAAFMDKQVTSVVIPASVKRVSAYAFYGRSSLGVVSGKGLKLVHHYAFDGCAKLQKVYHNGTASAWNNVNTDIGSNNVPDNATAYYYSAASPASGGNCWRYVDGEVAEW